MSRPRATGAFLFGPVAGPIEFSTGEIILLLLTLLAAALLLPALAGIVGVYRYRQRTPEAERSRKETTFVFLRWAGAAALIGLVIGYVNEFVSSRF